MTVEKAVTAAAVLQVAIDAPLHSPFDYLPPAGRAARSIAVGTRVRVPLGRRSAIGTVVAHAERSAVEPHALKMVQEIIDTAPLLDASMMQLLRWSAEYYHHPLGEVIAAALPKPLREGGGAFAQVALWRISSAGTQALADGLVRRAEAQRALLAALSVQPAGLEARALQALSPTWRAAARALRARGFIECVQVQQSTDAPHAPLSAPSLPGTCLSAAQALAVGSIDAAQGHFAAFVLQGATGSGKTEVYLQCARRSIERGQNVLVLVPEIGLTPQLVERFRQRLGVPMAVLHSRLTDGERLVAWRAARSGAARVVLGTRSAVFAPLPRLGLIVVDEEHDSSFKQQDGGCRYSARDIAVMRAQQNELPIVLGSATPAFETLHNVARGRYQALLLPRRADQSEAPRLGLVDLRAHPAHHGLSTPVVEAMRRHLDAQGQVLVFINRRGYAPTLLCTACGWIAPCHACDARLTVHQGSAELRCHHCGAVETLPSRCPRCGFALKPVGQGTERVEQTLRELLPDQLLMRLDRDTMPRGLQIESMFEPVISGAARIIVGTQMVTKGHHFPHLSLVVVLNSDQGLFSTDFRAAERLAQTIVQVAGRAGRERTRGEVLIQTEYPEHPLLQSLLTDGYEGFAQSALAERSAAHWPPFSRLALLRSSSEQRAGALDFLAAARAAAPAAVDVRLLGPVAAAMERRAGRYYAQLLLESRERAALHRFIDQWLPLVQNAARAHRVRYVLDVDPLDIQ